MSHYNTLSGTFSWRDDKIEWPVTSDVGPGLEGVIASDTAVSWLDPTSGSLSYRDVPIERLAGIRSFEEVAYLLITGDRDREEDELAAFRSRLRSSRALPNEVVQLIRSLDPLIHPTRLLRAGVSVLGCHELSGDEDMSGERHWRELRVVGQVAALVSEIARHRAGSEEHQYDERRSLAECMLVALLDRPPEPIEVETLDMLWVLYADHGLDAPTFTSMIVASTLADPYYNVVAGLSALRGPRLGGAGEQVLEQILDLADEVYAVDWVHEMVEKGGRIAGFGHRIYHMPDPRVVILRKQMATLARARGRGELFTIARAVEETATALLAHKGIHVNINFYAALLFHLLGADGPLVPVMYVVGRMAGLVARVHEALENPKLYRPLSQYLGTPDREMDQGGVE
ncbi:citrate/2-methylcitrate synthase [bacterium]|nr:citrate/2-methylcitrate synthase [bacterium]